MTNSARARFAVIAILTVTALGQVAFIGYRKNQQHLLKRPALEVNERTGAIATGEPGSRLVKWNLFRKRIPALPCQAIAFVSSTCPFCEKVANTMVTKTALKTTGSSTLPLTWLAQAKDPGATEWFTKHGVKGLVTSGVTWQHLGASFVPQVIVLDSEGTLLARGLMRADSTPQFGKGESERIEAVCHTE